MRTHLSSRRLNAIGFQVSSTVKPVLNRITSTSSLLVSHSRALLRRYPPIKAFVYTLVATSAIPIAVFTGYCATTFTGIMAVAGSFDQPIHLFLPV